MSEIAVALGRRIRQLRTDLHMSQEELSFKAGISPAHLGQIERAVKHPTVDTVGKIASALGVPASSLFTDETAPTHEKNATLEKITAQLSAMTEGEQRDILRVIRIFQSYKKQPSQSDDEI